MKNAILLLVIMLLIFIPIKPEEGSTRGLSLHRCYEPKVYTSISRLQSQGYALEHILRVYDTLGFVDNSNTLAMRLDIIAAYLDSKGDFYAKRLETCPN